MRSPKGGTLLCLDAGVVERVGCLVGSAPTTSTYRQALAILRVLGGARKRSYCQFASQLFLVNLVFSWYRTCLDPLELNKKYI